ncbi:hypothetical protein QLQ15_02220 [Lysobacter sp. LF1]|uniref:DUF5056 domain-containing protein n=1 Tax=Lysobacter stagni TaxID=3045172 RepID=A0ABT6XCG6_9GAMM|nr:hypothetical protein [Lysobacter sp. LF1]MDI9237724.1 hypothetical protein [Lysobacter sp. LF1]
MNTPNDRFPQRPLSHADRQRLDAEWLAQERAIEQERRGLPLDPEDARLAEYRLIARALRTPAMEPPPFDLTAQIVAHVERAQQFGERVEFWLLRGLGLLLAAVAAVAVGVYGADWVPAFAELWPSMSAQSSGWGGLLVACLVVSALWQGMGRLMRASGPLHMA